MNCSVHYTPYNKYSGEIIIRSFAGTVWYLCDNGCGKKYKHRTNLLRHKKNECGVEPQFKCPYCPKAYTQNASLKFHVQKQHTVVGQCLVVVTEQQSD